MVTPSPIGQTYGVELLLGAPVNLRDPQLLARIQASCPGAEVREGKASFAVVHSGAEKKRDAVAPQTAVLGSDKPFDPSYLEAALRQSWDWSSARSVVARVQSQVLVTDLMAAQLPHKERLALFQNTLLVLVKHLSPIAIHWAPAGKLVDPARFADAMGDPDASARAAIALNVRLVGVQDSPSDIVMDTLGLGALLLPDVQLHFRGLDCDAVARHLYNVALYVFEKGDTIADGHTIQGLAPGQKWRCRHETSLLGPLRRVIDLDPGPPFAAGDR